MFVRKECKEGRSQHPCFISYQGFQVTISMWGFFVCLFVKIYTVRYSLDFSLKTSTHISQRHDTYCKNWKNEPVIIHSSIFCYPPLGPVQGRGGWAIGQEVEKHSHPGANHFHAITASQYFKKMLTCMALTKEVFWWSFSSSTLKTWEFFSDPRDHSKNYRGCAGQLWKFLILSWIMLMETMFLKC